MRLLGRQDEMKILITGGTGFVGRALLERLKNDDYIVSATVRNPESALPDGVHIIPIGDIGPETDWSEHLDGIDIIVHIAARVHVIRDSAKNPLSEFRRINTQGTLNLALAAARAGVKRFVFLSTSKVNGESTMPGRPFFADDVPAPIDPYGISKLEAEMGLLSIAREHGMDVVILRPAVVYGPGVKGNFLSLLKVVDKRVPLPFGAVHNRRSMIGLDNLVGLIVTCAESPTAAKQIFLASDGDDISTTELLSAIGKAFGKPPILVPVPVAPMTAIATALGKKALVTRLFGNFQVDIEKTKRLLGWRPQVGLESELQRTVSFFRESQMKGKQ
jgi:nucleoside-diphosphate-sugar epimerase